jgi:uncharacterized lipoprotein YajG
MNKLIFPVLALLLATGCGINKTETSEEVPTVDSVSENATAFFNGEDIKVGLNNPLTWRVGYDLAGDQRLAKVTSNSIIVINRVRTDESYRYTYNVKVGREVLLNNGMVLKVMEIIPDDNKISVVRVK